jgi:hypothetical protein
MNERRDAHEHRAIGWVADTQRLLPNENSVAGPLHVMAAAAASAEIALPACALVSWVNASRSDSGAAAVSAARAGSPVRFASDAVCPARRCRVRAQRGKGR